jgi:hypothetical protein
VKVEENDIPDILTCWENRNNKKFIESREKSGVTGGVGSVEGEALEVAGRSEPLDL